MLFQAKGHYWMHPLAVVVELDVAFVEKQLVQNVVFVEEPLALHRCYRLAYLPLVDLDSDCPI